MKPFLFLIMISLALVSGTAAIGFADEILPIEKVPDVQPSPTVGETTGPVFDYMGKVFRIGKDESGKKIIVIHDRLKYFAPDAALFDEDGKPVSLSRFYKGRTVGFFVNEKREITRMDLIRD